MATKKSGLNCSWKSGVKKSSEKILDDDLDIRDLDYQHGKRYSQDTQQRKNLATWVTTIISVWLGSILIIFVCSGCGVLVYESSVIIALLSTTTVNIIALGVIVMKGLFGDASPKLT